MIYTVAISDACTLFFTALVTAFATDRHDIILLHANISHAIDGLIFILNSDCVGPQSTQSFTFTH
jgi:hypothetical protein